MVLNNINKNDSILLEVLASVFTVSSNFTDNPRKWTEFTEELELHKGKISVPAIKTKFENYRYI